MSWRLRPGASVAADGVHFRVWAPASDTVDVVVIAGPDAERMHPLAPEPGGWWSGTLTGVGPGTRYRFRLDKRDAYPDPASRFQPEGPHGPSQVVDPAAFSWTDAGWRGRSMDDLVIYELHVGAATAEGTFDALIPRLPELKELGITAIELMPVAQFPGDRNWGYDGVQIFAPAAAYGGPEAMRRLIDAAHGQGLAVILDVVYNHLGPEGNYLHPMTAGRIMTSRHQTPWGDAIDYACPAVREMLVGNALHWAHEYHLDGLRLDATHAIQDDSATHLLAEIVERIRASLPADRHFLFIAEDERNERRLLAPAAEGGWGMDAVWADDFHHQVRVLTAGDRDGYYAAYQPDSAELARTLQRGWYYEGQPLPEGHRRGTPAAGLPPRAFVHCIQNHDQVGNRPLGDRLNHAIDPAAYRAASALLLLSPYTPLLWMGQEWAASTPFLYFTDHSPELGRQVTEGRRAEFSGFGGFSDPERIPDPQARATFERSKLDWSERERPPHAGVLALYRDLLALRAREPALRSRVRDSFAAAALGRSAVSLRRGELLLVVSLDGGLAVDLDALPETRPPAGASWAVLLATEERRFAGEAGSSIRLADGRLELGGGAGVLLRAIPGPR